MPQRKAPTREPTAKPRTPGSRVMEMQAAVFRRFIDAFAFWQMCDRPACRRRQRCSGDAHACFKWHWSFAPEDEKEYWRGAIKAGKTTRSAEEMHRAGLAARDACRKRMEQTAAPKKEPKKEETAAEPGERPAGPDIRVRRL